ncbi:MAG TPA: YoaK family protein [Terriglobales bacterium]|nr:YoaK family protein [Terriglobales bacterium]
MPEAQTLGEQRAKSAVALLLTFVAGVVDIVGYLGIYHIFTAHLTGTTVHLGHDLMQRNWAAAAMAGSVVAGFFFGSVAGRAVIEAGARAHFHRVASLNLAAEAALLAVFVPLSRMEPTAATPAMCLLLAILAIAMGVQTATVTRIGALTIHTTFVTGMVNKLAQLVSHILFHSYDMFRATNSRQKDYFARMRHSNSQQAWFIFSIWLLYLAGAIAGTALYSRIQLNAMYMPAGLLVLTIATDQVKPLSLQEERDQMER